MSQNPFPGPRPYRAADRERFFGRDELAERLRDRALAHRCITVFGPSGAGKSSLMQAAVIPALEEHDDFRVVRVDTWPEGTAPTAWLAAAMFDALRLEKGVAEEEPALAVIAAAERAARRSDRPILIYLDQIEQLLFPSRDAAETEALLDCIARLVRLPLRQSRVVLSLREDYLGRLRDRLRDRFQLLDHGFRVGPLSVGELADAVCKAARSGDPPQTWELEPMLALMLQVRVPGQAASELAEAQAAYAQIVCRALWDEQAAASDGGSPNHGMGSLEAAPILERYLEATLQAMGSLREDARRLLEDHLIAEDGSRTLRTERELGGERLAAVLTWLEAAAIVRAEEHQGTRYFELGHDWLARKVHERRQERVREEEERRREEERLRVLAQQKAERRTLRLVTILSITIAALMAMLGYSALRRGEEAQAMQKIAESQRQAAFEAASRARTASLMAGARELLTKGQPAAASSLLLEVPAPEHVRGWIEFTHNVFRYGLPNPTLRGHHNALNSAAFSPDGKLVVTASADKTARVWNIDGRGEPVVLRGHKAPINAAAWSPDGKRIVTASDDKTARVWNSDGSGEPIILEGHEREIASAAFSPDGKQIVTASADKTARIWNADKKADPVVLEGHEAGLYGAAFSPDGKRIVTASSDATARVWTSDGSGEPIVLKRNKGSIVSAMWSADGKHIVTASVNGVALVWSADGKGEPAALAHDAPLYSAAFSPDGERVVTACKDNVVRIWTADGRWSKRARQAPISSFHIRPISPARVDEPAPPIVLKGHEGYVRSAVWSPDGRRIVTASWDHTARVWAANGKGEPLILAGHEGFVDSALWSPDGTRIITASKDRTARIWSAQGSGEPRVFRGHSSFVRSASWSPDGERFVTASWDKSVRVWNAKGIGALVVLRGHERSVNSAAFSPDGKRIITSSDDNTARVWSADGSGEPRVLTGHAGPVTSAAFSADGARIVTASADKTARILNADGSGEPVILRGHTEGLSSAAFSPDGKRVVTTSSDKTARVWSADGSGAPIVLEGHRGFVFSAVFSPDGKRVVTASGDKTARVWSADGSGEPIVLRGHLGTVLSAAWSRDGSIIATGSDDETARLWASDGSVELSVLEGHERTVTSVELSPDDRSLLTASDDTTARIWSIAAPDIENALRKAISDCLSVDMRKTYLDESEADARSGYEACEREHGRAPFYPEESDP